MATLTCATLALCGAPDALITIEVLYLRAFDRSEGVGLLSSACHAVIGWQHFNTLHSQAKCLTAKCMGGTGGNPYATPEVSNHPGHEMAHNPKLAPEATNGKPVVP